MEQFDVLLAQTIDSTLGLRCTMFGYQYSEILRSLMCVYLCGGSCIEDVTTHLMKHLSLHPTLRTCSADTILRAIEELTCKNITYKSASDKSYDFNTADKTSCQQVLFLLWFHVCLDWMENCWNQRYWVWVEFHPCWEMERKTVSSCHSETEADGGRPRYLGRRIHIMRNTNNNLMK